MDFVTGGAAAVCAGFFTNPLEVMKTRMQLQGELTTKGSYNVHYKNVFHAGYVIAKHDGILALQKGLVPGLWFQLFLNGFRFGSFGLLEKHGYLKDKNGNLIFYRNVLASGISGAIASFLASPFFLIKVHLQSQASKEIAFGHQHHYNGTWSGLWKIFQEQGIRGLFRGAAASMPRLFFGSTAQLTSFAYFKDHLQSKNILIYSPLTLSFVASMAAGGVVAIFITPFDLITTRLYNQGVDKNGKGLLYGSYWDCVSKVFKTEGLFGFYKGIGASYFRIGPHTVLCLVFWDAFNNLLVTNNNKLAIN